MIPTTFLLYLFFIHGIIAGAWAVELELEQPLFSLLRLRPKRAAPAPQHWVLDTGCISGQIPFFFCLILIVWPNPDPVMLNVIIYWATAADFCINNEAKWIIKNENKKFRLQCHLWACFQIIQLHSAGIFRSLLLLLFIIITCAPLLPSACLSNSAVMVWKKKLNIKHFGRIWLPID